MIALCGCEHCRGKVMLKKQILKEMVNDIQVIRMVVNKIEGDLKIVMVKKNPKRDPTQYSNHQHDRRRLENCRF
ncbi:unnamed protein product [Acanthoscelides obtectus]|uniref:Uncharacterized protein n=1 Tax=Acanthoscelides obtectus TaxID=200917 RepID=A0A9P0QDN2_ACAOB|nr:unnamed protein product [Acanthoscelides obtectus]CAK1685503.1 hypothetical protein AOBTE_LOCUS35459 [Acanthoscelides obtectus]